MKHDLYKFKRKLIEQKNRAAEDRRINQSELSFQPLFWIAIVLSLIAFYTGYR